MLGPVDFASDKLAALLCFVAGLPLASLLEVLLALEAIQQVGAERLVKVDVKALEDLVEDRERLGRLARAGLCGRSDKAEDVRLVLGQERLDVWCPREGDELVREAVSIKALA